jgi:hypothetical protein
VTATSVGEADCAAATAKSDRMGSNAIILLLIDNVVERVKLVVSRSAVLDLIGGEGSSRSELKGDRGVSLAMIAPGLRQARYHLR